MAAASGSNNQRLDCSSHEVTIPGSNLIVSLPPPVELMCCNEAAPLNSNCQPVIAEHELDRLPPDGCHEPGCSGSFCSNEQTGVSAQQTIMEPHILQISESTVHPQRLEDLLSERTSPMHLGGTGFQPVVSYADSLSSARDTIVPTQHRLSDAVVESVPSNHHTTDNTINSSRSSSEHLRSTGFQQDQGNQLFPNFMSLSWIPIQAVYADPFQNELFRIRKQSDSCNKKHEDKVVFFVSFLRNLTTCLLMT